MPIESMAFLLGLNLYVANLVLGVAVQFRLLSTKRFHWVHHALYGLVFLAAGVATLLTLLARVTWWPLVLTLLALALLPRFRGGSRPHMGLALLGFCGYGLKLLLG